MQVTINQTVKKYDVVVNQTAKKINVNIVNQSKRISVTMAALGRKGIDGKSAYQISLDNGFIGTVQEWLSLLFSGGSIISVNGQTGEVTITIPTKTSDLTNDGTNGTHPFITLEDLPANPSISGTLGTVPIFSGQGFGESQIAESDGNVTVGGGFNFYKFNVNGGMFCKGFIFMQGSAGDFRLYDEDGIAIGNLGFNKYVGANMGTYVNLPFFFYVNGLEAMRISTSHNILIGRTIDTGQKLQVEGSALITERLELQSVTEGFLPPRMTTSQINAIANPINGETIFNTDLNVLCFFTTSWQKVASTLM